MAISAFVLSIALASDPSDAALAAKCPRVLSIVEISRDRSELAGNTVCVRGILHIEFEGSYVASDSARLWVNFFDGPPWTDEGIRNDKERMEDWKRRYQDSCVVVRGTYDPTDKGHMGMYPAGSITRLDGIWPESTC